MKTHSIASIMVVLILCLPAINAMGQNGENELEMKKFGLGLHMQQFKISEIDDLMMPVNKVLFTFNTSEDRFRIEPEIGFVYFTQKYWDDFNISVTGIQLGVGMFGMYQIEKTNIYYGGRFNYGRIKESSDAEWFESETYSVFSVGPALGVEYYFSNHFSIGGEISIKYKTFSEDDYVDFFDEQVISTNTGLMLRFYF